MAVLHPGRILGIPRRRRFVRFVVPTRRALHEPVAVDEPAEDRSARVVATRSAMGVGLSRGVTLTSRR